MTPCDCYWPLALKAVLVAVAATFATTWLWCHHRDGRPL